MHTYILTHIHTYIHNTHVHNRYIHIYILTHIHTYIHNTYIHTYTHNTYIHSYIHIYIHTYIHTCKFCVPVYISQTHLRTWHWPCHLYPTSLSHIDRFTSLKLFSSSHYHLCLKSQGNLDLQHTDLYVICHKCVKWRRYETSRIYVFLSVHRHTPSRKPIPIYRPNSI
jgi:hypothetical protein